MSTATELAEVEAACAEAELSDEEAAVVRGGMDEGVPLHEAIALVKEARDQELAATNGHAPIVGEVSDDQLEQLDKAKVAHLRKVKTILGPLAESLAECDHCDGMGLAPPGEPAPEPKAHEYFQACETCNALGQVLTGSRVGGNVFRPCPDCGGRGYLEALDAAGNPLVSGGSPGSAAVAFVTPSAEELAAGASATAPEGPRFGRPAWMGDPAIGA